MSKKNRYVLMLTYIDEQKLDIAGNEYGLDGFVRASEFTYDIDIRYGLSGYPWGLIKNLIYEKIDGKWVVVKIEQNDELICIDRNRNKHKFRIGLISCIGSLRKTYRYISNQISDRKTEFIPESYSIDLSLIAGSSAWMKNYRLFQKRSYV